jgi:talin
MVVAVYCPDACLFANTDDHFVHVTMNLVAGIANHEEYSLVRDLSDTERERTLTLRRDKSIAKDQKKMDEMKKKLHTDDEC